MSERLSSAEACQRLVKRSLENFRLPYITITPTFSICPKHGYLEGEHEFCPRCDEILLQQKLPAIDIEEETCKTITPN
jgi:ribonucleoside-triphosphate reductase